MINKDWTGNKKSTFTTLGASSHSIHDREVNDYYATQPSVINDLFIKEEFNGIIWECACGEGHLAKRMEELGKTVKSTDLIDRGFGVGGVDFLLHNTREWNTHIITNPPYKYAQEFVDNALDIIQDGYKVAMFLKLTFLEGQERKKLFEKYPPKIIYVFSKRQKCALNGKFEETGSSAAAYAWFVWQKGFKGEPIIKWI